jgi:hypothetical protein
MNGYTDFKGQARKCINPHTPTKGNGKNYARYGWLGGVSAIIWLAEKIESRE